MCGSNNNWIVTDLDFVCVVAIILELADLRGEVFHLFYCSTAVGAVRLFFYKKIV